YGDVRILAGFSRYRAEDDAHGASSRLFACISRLCLLRLQSKIRKSAKNAYARGIAMKPRISDAPVQDQPIYVTQPQLAPLAEFIPYLEQIWENRILTNGGPFHQQFEQALCEYLNVEHLSLFANGTLGLVTALQALRITGEVITTPYSFVATAHSLLWNGIKPVFADVEPGTLNLDPAKIEAAR